MDKILVVGSLNMDLAVLIKDFPKPGETILGKDFLVSPGGKGANQAYAAGRLGGNVKILGCIGDDDYGKLMKQNLSNVNVNVNSLKTIDNISTGIAIIMNADSGENNITVISGANAYLNKQLIKNHISLIRDADYVLTQLETPLETVEYLADVCATYNKTFVLDPSPAEKNLSEKIFCNIDIIKPNETELSILTGMPVDSMANIKKAAQVLLDKGVKNVITTLGSKGTLWTHMGESQFFPARKVTAVDTTAAGDTFLAALICGLAKGKNYVDAITYANIASSISVTKRGAQRSIPSADDIERVIKEEECNVKEG